MLICSRRPRAPSRSCPRSSRKIPGCRPLDAGELSNATAIEAFTAVLLQLNVRYKTRVAPKFTGITRRGIAMLRLYDTARQAVVPVRAGPLVTMYTCGITPYDATHLGHATVYVAYDVLQRRLLDLGHEVRCVRNITDVDDPLLAKARELGVHYLDLAAGEMARFDADMEALNVLPCSASRGRRRPSPTSAASSAWCSTGATPTRPAAPSTSTCRRSRASARSATTTEDTMLAFAARARRQRRRSRTSATRSTSCCGSRRRPTSRRGRRCGARAGPGGTSSARRWRCASSAPRSTSTAAAPT